MDTLNKHATEVRSNDSTEEEALKKRTQQNNSPVEHHTNTL